MSRQRSHSLGVLADGCFECGLCDRANGDIFTCLLGSLGHKYGKLIAVLDNAAYKSGKDTRFA